MYSNKILCGICCLQAIGNPSNISPYKGCGEVNNGACEATIKSVITIQCKII